MFILRLVPVFMLFTLLTGPSLFLPGQVNAYHCCSCSNPRGSNCGWRGVGHCPGCRAGDSDLFQTQAPTIIPASSFTASHDPLDLTPPTTDLSEETLPMIRAGNRGIGDVTLRLLAGPEFRIKSWCPESL